MLRSILQYATEQISRDDVRHALLALLSEGPKYGLQLGQEFEARTGEVWPLNIGQVYTTLQRLERDGLVESDDAAEDGPQKGFRITAAGHDELRRVAADAAGHVGAAPRRAGDQGVGGAAGAGRRRRRPGAGAPPPPRRDDALLHAAQGGRRRGRRRSVARGRRRAVPARRAWSAGSTPPTRGSSGCRATDEAPAAAGVGRGRAGGWGHGDDRGARAAAGVEVLRRGTDAGRGVAGRRPDGRRR